MVYLSYYKHQTGMINLVNARNRLIPGNNRVIQMFYI